tara:strand:- start:412 stop:585 length:174 start_codon:yes stop_codon:yes gene_type:complete
MKWRDDKDFCAWLVRMNYAEQIKEETQPKLTSGLLCYVWEAWQAAKGRVVAGWNNSA